MSKLASHFELLTANRITTKTYRDTSSISGLVSVCLFTAVLLLLFIRMIIVTSGAVCRCANKSFLRLPFSFVVCATLYKYDEIDFCSYRLWLNFTVIQL